MRQAVPVHRDGFFFDNPKMWHLLLVFLKTI
jgi:hypothetical protein